MSQHSLWGVTRSERLAYAAGLFDGEGCIHIGSHTTANGATRYKLVVLIAMTQTAPLLFMQELFGGVVKEKTTPANGKKQQWVWALYSHEAVPFLEAILPMLLIKDKEAGVALLFQSTFNKSYKIGGNGGQVPLPANIVTLRQIAHDECKLLKKVNE